MLGLGRGFGLSDQPAGGGGGGGGGSGPVYSAVIYTGTGSAQDINAGIDMSGGGWMMIKSRSTAANWEIIDSSRGATNFFPMPGASVSTSPSSVSAFTTTGFSLTGSLATGNAAGVTYVAYCFKKATGFCDIVPYTGTGTFGRVINHSVGAVPTIYFTKRPNASSNLVCDVLATALAPTQFDGGSNVTLQYTSAGWTSTSFQCHANGENTTGVNFLMYLLATDSNNFYTNDKAFSGGTAQTWTLPWEPEFVWIRTANASGIWHIGCPAMGNSHVGSTNAAQNGRMTFSGSDVTFTPDQAFNLSYTIHAFKKKS